MADDKQTQAVPVWNVETLRAHISDMMDAYDQRMSERHASTEKAIRVAFEAQTTAMQAAFTAQKEAVTTAFMSQKEAVNAALAAADRAVIKAELAAEKRFEAVNEFRATLADQQRTLMPRSEAEAISKAFESRLSSETKVLSDKIEVISKQLSVAGGVRTGEKFGWQYSVAVIGLVALALGIISAIYGLPHK